MSELFMAIGIVLLSSAICSGTEAALMSVTMVRVKQLAETKTKSALALLGIKEKMDAPIATIVILNNIANIVGSMTVGLIAAKVLDSAWMAWFSGGLTFAVILFSELIPKTVGEMFSERIALFTARPVKMLTFILYPVIWVMNLITSPITKHAKKFTTDESEITFMAKIGEETGAIEEDESTMIQKVFQMNDLTAYDVMTPRVNMSCVDISEITASNIVELAKKISALQHTRIIVIDGRYDNVVGVVFDSEVLYACLEHTLSESDSDVDLVHDIHRFPQSTKADVLLKYFQESKQHIAVVEDEFGGVAGVVTLEDVIEIITGEIMDENDHTEDLRKVNHVKDIINGN